jgi:hypothetical protein
MPGNRLWDLKEVLAAGAVDTVGTGLLLQLRAAPTEDSGVAVAVAAIREALQPMRAARAGSAADLVGAWVPDASQALRVLAVAAATAERARQQLVDLEEEEEERTQVEQALPPAAVLAVARVTLTVAAVPVWAARSLTTAARCLL